MAITTDSIVNAVLKLSTSKKIFILIVMLGVITAGFLYWDLFPQLDEVDRLNADYDRLVRELNENIRISNDLQKFEEQFKKSAAQFAAALTQLPNEKEIPDILRNISSLGKESNLDFILFRPKPEEPEQFIAKVPIELTVVGTYPNTGIFFDRVSKLPRLINVVDFNMSRVRDVKGRGDSKDENLVKTSCLINTYRFLEKKGEEKKSEKKKIKEETEEEIPRASKK